MSEDLQKQFETFGNLMNMAADIREVTGAAGEFFAMLLVADLEKLERAILDGLKGYEEASKRFPPGRAPIDIGPVNDKVALLNCLMRFRDDIAANTIVGRKCKEKYDKMKTALNT